MNLHTFKTLTEKDRDNLADIAWFIKGLIASQDTETFQQDHLDTLSHVMGAIANKLIDEKNDKGRIES